MAETVGFVGLGNMGKAMALRLLEQGWKVRAWNRSAQKAQALVARGATLAERVEDVAEPGGVVLSILSDDRAVSEIFGPETRLLSRLGSGGMHVSMSTIHPETSRRLAREHERAGVAYLCAPVFGRPDSAAQGNLWIVASGEPSALNRAQPLFQALGRKTFAYGDDPGAANVAKLCGNFLIASAMEAMGEAATMAEKCGAGARPVIEMLSQTLFACPVYQGYGPRIVSREFEPVGFRLILGLKDIDLVLSTAGSAGVPMPIADLVRDRALSGISKGRAEWDWSSMTLGAAEDAGLNS
jgi:3-hydroxyisobutyrate dehydrogenase-like beta-hydroxyacid dehydrogenase